MSETETRELARAVKAETDQELRQRERRLRHLQYLLLVALVAAQAMLYLSWWGRAFRWEGFGLRSLPLGASVLLAFLIIVWIRVCRRREVIWAIPPNPGNAACHMVTMPSIVAATMGVVLGIELVGGTRTRLLAIEISAAALFVIPWYFVGKLRSKAGRRSPMNLWFVWTGLGMAAVMICHLLLLLALELLSPH